MKSVATVVLLAFVATTVVFLVIDESKSEGVNATGTPRQGDVHTPMASAAPQIIAYYFHGAARCPTCLRMEAWAQAAVEANFAAEVKTGKVQWLAINYDLPANEHFVKKYALTASAVVLVRDGEGPGWRNLTRIWDLTADEIEFKSYVAHELADLLRSRS